MKDQLDIRTKDLRRLAAAVDRAHFTECDTDTVPISALQEIRDLVRCDEVCHLAINPLAQEFVLDVGLAPEYEPPADVGTDTMDEWYWHMFRTSMSCSFQYWTGDHVTPHRATDFYESRRDYFGGEFGEFLRVGGGRYSTIVPLPSEGPVEHQLILFRDSGRDFSERDQLVLGLLGPHLAGSLIEARARRRRNGLTARQAQLVTLVADGLTNRQIASRLQLSEGTVRTHMEHVFERLGVTSRAAAVSALLGEGGSRGPVDRHVE